MKKNLLIIFKENVLKVLVYNLWNNIFKFKILWKSNLFLYFFLWKIWWQVSELRVYTPIRVNAQDELLWSFFVDCVKLKKRALIELFLKAKAKFTTGFTFCGFSVPKKNYFPFQSRLHWEKKLLKLLISQSN